MNSTPSNPVAPSQPMAEEQRHDFIWLQPWCDGCDKECYGSDGRQWCQDDAWSDCEECERPAIKYVRADAHASLKARLEQAERAVDVLESNARVQARLLADTGRRAEKLEGALKPFADFADPRNTIPPDTILTAGSPMARKQITMSDCYEAKRALSAGNGEVEK